jgi:hypothetical protein
MIVLLNTVVWQQADTLTLADFYDLPFESRPVRKH